MGKYELLCVLPGTLAEDELPARLQAVEKAITDQGGTEVSTEDLGKTRLAYPMKHIRYGYFYRFIFSAEGTDVAKIQEKLRLITELLRAMVSVYDADRVAAYNKRIAELNAKSDAPAPAAPVATEEKKEEAAAPAKKEEKEADMKEIDQKLDEILDKSLADA